MKRESKAIAVLGLIVTILAALFSVYTWQAGEESGVGALSLQNEQVRLLNSLVYEVGQSNKNLELIHLLSERQLASSEIVARLSRVVAERRLDSNVGVEELQAIIDDEHKSSSKLISDLNASAPSKEAPVVGKVGWIYVGKYNDRQAVWNTQGYNKTIEGYLGVKIKKGDPLVISKEVGFNSFKPKFPTYTKGLKRIFPYSLMVGTKVKVNEVADDVGLKDFTWANVTVISP